MEVITGNIKEKKEVISGEIKEYCDQEPVLVKDSAGTLLYTKNPGEIAIITDGIIKDAANNTLHLIKAQGTQIIANSNVQNSDNSYNASILAEGSLVLPDITVTNPITGGTYTKPAAKDFTESVYKEIELGFKANYDDNQEYLITAKRAGTYSNETLVNCTVVYEVNSVVVTLPFTVVNTDTLKATITRTNAALDASVTITT